jgi:hypothetical protein
LQTVPDGSIATVEPRLLIVEDDCVGFTDADFDSDRLARVRQTCTALTEQAGWTITPRFIDARPQASASKL